MGKIISGLKRHIKIFPITVAVILMAVLVAQFLVSANGEFEDINPQLELWDIESDAEQAVDRQPLYVHETEFKQGSELENGGYHIETNAYVPWLMEDDVAFACKKYNVKDTGDDYVEAILTIDKRPYSRPGSEAHSKAALGLMFRSGPEPTDAHVFLQVRNNGVMAVYRTKSGDTTVSQDSQPITYPVQLRMYKQGNTVRMSYRSGTEGTWMNMKYPAGLRATGPLYVGIAANSSSQEAFVCGDFSGLTVKGIGTYEEGGSGGEEPEQPVEEYVEEDPPLLPNTLLRETFSDGEFKNTPASVTNPIWKKPLNHEIVNINGNRKWFKNFDDYDDFVGDQTWTDYIVSVDLEFTEDCNPDELAAQNRVQLYARHQDIPVYGHRDYYLTIQAGYKMEIRKRCFEKDDYKAVSVLLGSFNLRTLRDKITDELIFTQYGDGPDDIPKTGDKADEEAKNRYSCLGDGKTHKLALRVFDNVLTAYWDGVEVFSVTDNGTNRESGHFDQIFGKGSVGIATIETSVYIDNLQVIGLKDDFGGDYDNEIEGNWNQPIPDYVKNWNH